MPILVTGSIINVIFGKISSVEMRTWCPNKKKILDFKRYKYSCWVDGKWNIIVTKKISANI